MSTPNFDIAATLPGVWKDHRLQKVGDTIALTTSQAIQGWCGRLVTLIIECFSSDMSLKTIREAFAKQRQALLKTYDLQSLTSDHKIQEIQTCNKNLQQLNEKIQRHNDRVWWLPWKKCDKLDLLPLPSLEYYVQGSPRMSLHPERFIGIPVPKEDHRPDVKQMDQWVARQPAALQPLAYELGKSVLRNYIDFPSFVSFLDKTIKSIESQIGDRPFGITYDYTENKSGNWTANLAQFQRTPNAKTSTMSFHHLFSSLRPLTEEEAKIHDWVLIDDASYSASQLQIILNYMISGLVKYIPEGEIRIYLAVPFMTEYANTFLSDINKVWNGKDLSQENLERIKIIPSNRFTFTSIENVIATLPCEEDRRLARNVFKLDSDVKSQQLATTYFAHKVGDSLSFPHWVLSGDTVNYDYKTDKITKSYAFFAQKPQPIPSFIPPYKPNGDA